MSITKGLVGIVLALVCALALSGTVVHAQELEGFEEFEVTFEDADFDNFYLDEEFFDFGDEDFDEMPFFDDESFIDDFDYDFYNEEDFADFDEDIFYDDELDFGDSESFFDSYDSLYAPEWEEVRALVEMQDESDILWDAVLPDIETGEVQIWGSEDKALFGLFNIDMKVSRMLDIDGVLSDIDRPWYAIFAW